ncbi:MAG: DUF3667 domain-containing protein [Pseudomonadota bacterium]
MSAECGNCGEALTGDYCFACGQPRRSPIMSIGELTSEYLRDVFSLDSRAWRTLSYLMFRPGAMTADYLAGRRHAYTPPVRLYLLTSLLFLAIFTVPLLLEGVSENFRTATTLTEEDGAQPTDAPADPAADTDPVDGQLDSLDAQIEEIVRTNRERIEEPPATPDALSADEGEAAAVAEEEDQCADMDIEMDGISAPWLRSLLRQRAERACQLFTREGGPQRFAEEFLDALPAMLLAILPLMALCLTVLYLFSGRRYVEHLILLSHYHSFVFLLIGLTVLLAGLPLWGWIKGLLITYTSVYTPWYLYRAMRTVYGQGRLLTAVKFSVLSFAYMVGLSVALGVGLLLAVESFTR